MARIPIALELYSVREDCARDFAGTLKAVAKMGYEGVEFAGYHNKSATELRKMLDDLGLRAAGTHTGLASLQGDELKRTLEFNQEVGNTYQICPGADYSTKPKMLELARALNEASHQACKHGLSVGYHNHWAEFQPVEGVLPWEVIAFNTEPGVVLQLDIGHCLRAGRDVVADLRTCVERAKTIHIKERGGTGHDWIVGEGDMPWRDIFQVAEDAGATEWYIVEQEEYPCPPLEAVERAIKNLRGMGK